MFLSKSRQYPRHWASVPNGHTRLSIALAVSWCLVSPTAVAGRDPLPIRSLLLRHPGLGPFAVADPPQARLQLTTRQHTILSGVRDGTPLIDIKPYIPQFDNRPDATSGWLKSAQDEVERQRSDDRFA